MKFILPKLNSLVVKCGLVLVLIGLFSAAGMAFRETRARRGVDIGRAIAANNAAHIALSRFMDRLHVAELTDHDQESWLLAGKELQTYRESFEVLQKAVVPAAVSVPFEIARQHAEFEDIAKQRLASAMSRPARSGLAVLLRTEVDLSADQLYLRFRQFVAKLDRVDQVNANRLHQAEIGSILGLVVLLVAACLFVLVPISKSSARELTLLRSQNDHLLRSRRLLISMFEKVPVATVLTLDQELHLNHEAQRMMAVEGRGIVKIEDWFQLVFGEQADEARANYSEHKRSGFRETSDFDFKNRDGLAQSVRFSGYDDGDIELWIMQDMTSKRRAEERFQLLFERSSDPHILFDDFGIIDCNEAAVKALRCRDKNHLLSLHMAVFSPEWQPDGRASLEKMHEMGRLAHENGLQRFEWTQRRFDGVEIESSVILNSIELNGRRAIISVWHDISVRKQMERELREKQLFLQRLVEHLPVALYCKDGANDLRYTVWNRQAEEIWGVSAHEAIGRREQDFELNESPGEGERTQRNAKHLGTHDIQKEIDLIAAGRAVEIEEERVESRDHTQRIVRSVKVPLTDGSGRPRFLLGISENITERKRIETELKIREAALIEAQKLAKTGSFEIDAKTLQGHWSPQAAINLGLTSDAKFNEVKWSSILHPEDLPLVRDAVAQCRTGEQFLSIEFRVVKPDGSINLLYSYAKPVFESRGECTKIVGTLQDVTEKKRQEQLIRSQELLIFQSAKMSSLGEMAGGIAHEINNPLAIIQSAADQLLMRIERGSLDAVRAGTLVNKITSTTERIAKIIQGLRTFARDGKADPLETKDLRFILEETLEFCRTRFKNHGVELEVTLPAEPALVDCRPIEISQVALNLLNNAFDAVESSPLRRIHVEIRALAETCELRVTDSGPGVPADVRDRIFLPFFTTKEVGKGTGLGLSISAEIIRAHEGSLGLDEGSKAGAERATTFLIVLPRKQVESLRGAA